MFYIKTLNLILLLKKYQSEKVNETERTTDLKDLIENGITNRDSSQKEISIAIAINSGSSALGIKYTASLQIIFQNLFFV